MDDIDNDEEHDTPLGEDFNMTGLGDENDTDDDNDVAQPDEADNMYVDPVMNFS